MCGSHLRASGANGYISLSLRQSSRSFTSCPSNLSPEEALMDRQACCTAKAQMIARMQDGQPWQEAARQAGVQTSRTAAYRLLQRVRTEGAAALEDQRHGHPTKVCEPVRQWLVQFCRAAPEVTG